VENTATKEPIAEAKVLDEAEADVVVEEDPKVVAVEEDPDVATEVDDSTEIATSATNMAISLLTAGHASKKRAPTSASMKQVKLCSFQWRNQRLMGNVTLATHVATASNLAPGEVNPRMKWNYPVKSC
jgi:hypothetical protein